MSEPIFILPPREASDAELTSGIADLVNAVYATAEEGLWAEGVSRTSPREVAEFIGDQEIAVAYAGRDLIGCVRVYRLAAGRTRRRVSSPTGARGGDIAS